MKKPYLMLLLLLACCLHLGAQTRTENWNSDLDHLLKAIKEQHYIYKNKPLPETLATQVAMLRKNIGHYSDERMLAELEKLMYHLGDGHSYVLPFGSKIVQSHYLPLHFYEFSDGMFVIDTDSAHSHLYGMKVKRIGNKTTEQLMKDMETYISQDNTMGAKWIGPFFLRFRGLLEMYGLKAGAGTIAVEFENRDGKIFTEQVNFVPVPRLRGIPKLVPAKNAPAEKIPLYLSNVQTAFWLKHLPEQKTMYFQFNQVSDTEEETIQGFSKRLSSELKKNKPSLLIVDVRHNNGGNGDLTPPLIVALKRYEREQKARIVVITGRNTFSAAQIFITQLDKETDAIFAGEPSSSCPNFVGEENGFALPWSGAMGSISNRYHENNPGDNRKWIAPKLPVTLSSKDFFENRDPVLEAVLAEYAQ